jgi:hypothetical protein
VTFINANKQRWGAEPACRVLQVAPATYHTAMTRPPSARSIRDGELEKSGMGVTPVAEGEPDPFVFHAPTRQTPPPFCLSPLLATPFLQHAGLDTACPASGEQSQQLAPE